MYIKYILSVGKVEPFNEPVLHGPSLLYVLDIYPLGLVPSREIEWLPPSGTSINDRKSKIRIHAQKETIDEVIATIHELLGIWNYM